MSEFAFPAPPANTGLEWRSPAPDDAEALARHAASVDHAERLEYVDGPAFIRWMMSQHDFDPDSEWLIGVDRSGEVAVEAGAWTQVTEAGGRSFLWFGALPGHEHLKPYLLSAAEWAAEARLADVPAGLERVIRCPVEEHRAAHRAVVEAAGYSPARSFVVMERSLASLPEPAQGLESVMVVPWSADFGESTRLANNDAFADHWGSLPMSPEAWADMYYRSEEFRPDLSNLAIEGDRVVSFCIVEIDEESNEDRGVREIYVNKVGTVRDHRRRRIATHLLERSLVAAAALGMERAALNVDEDSNTNATRIYSRLGFEITMRSIHYVKNL